MTDAHDPMSAALEAGTTLRAGSDPVARPASHIDQVHGDLANNIANAHRLVAELTDKLHPVLQPEQDVEGHLASADRPSRSPLATALDEDSTSVAVLNGRLAELLARLEV